MAKEPPKEAPKGRPPDYSLNCLHKASDARGKVGAAWKNSDGSIRIVIDPFAVIPPGREIVLTLFPAGSYEKREEKPKSPRSAADALDDAERSREAGDEVPF